MVSKNTFLWSCHILVWTAAALAFWATGASAAVRYDVATPHTPPYNNYKYIPLNPKMSSYEPDTNPTESNVESSKTGMAPSEFILSTLRTFLDVVRKYNKDRAKKAPAANNTAAERVHKREPFNSTAMSGRGFEDYYDEHHYHDHDTTTTTTAKPKGRYTDPWAGYYDWIINEGSFKFWSVFQLFTAALLLYACFSAIYYAKFNPIIPDYDREYDDYFLERSVGRSTRSLESWELPSGLSWINPRTFQFILDAISKNYED